MDGYWRSDLETWLAPFLATLRHKTRARMCPVYIAGLIGPGDRKSIQPMATRTGDVSYDQLHHFVASGVWDAAPLEAALLAEADAQVGGNDAWLIIDDTSLPKKGMHSVGVAPQYASTLGKNANCQTLVSLTLASREVPVMVGLRLFLPESWTSDPTRLDHAGVPLDCRDYRTKPEIALAEIDRGSRRWRTLRLRVGGRWLRDERLVPAGSECTRPNMGRWHPVQAESLSCRRGNDFSRRRAWSPPQAAYPRCQIRIGKDDAGDGKVAQGQLAARDQGAPLSTLRRRSRSSCRWPASTHTGHGRATFARRGSVAGRRTSLNRRAQILPLQPVLRHADQAACWSHQGPLGLRTGTSATQGRARPRSLRRPIMERASPTCADVNDCLGLPAIPPPQAGQGEKKESPGRHHSRACRRSGRPSSNASPNLLI